MTTMSRSTPRTITVRHVWLAALGLTASSVRNVRNARDIAGRAVETFDVVQRRIERRASAWRQSTWTRL